MIKNPCRNCTKRVVGCHSTCKDYKDWKKEDQERKDIIYKNKNKERFYRSTATTKLHRKKRNMTSHNKVISYMKDK